MTIPASLRLSGDGLGLSAEETRGLVMPVRRGDIGAWEALYGCLYPRLLAYSGRRLPSEDAKEAVAETFARAVAGVNRRTGTPARFDGWIFGTCRHVVIDIQRQHGGDGYGLPGDVVVALPEPDDESDPQVALVAKEEREELRCAYLQLDEPDRELLDLRVLARLSARDAGRVLGKRPGRGAHGAESGPRSTQVTDEGGAA